MKASQGFGSLRATTRRNLSSGSVSSLSEQLNAELARDCVNNDRFACLAPMLFNQTIEKGLDFVSE